MSEIRNSLSLKARQLEGTIRALKSQIKETEGCLSFKKSLSLQNSVSEKKAMLARKELELAALRAGTAQLSSTV